MTNIRYDRLGLKQIIIYPQTESKYENVGSIQCAPIFGCLFSCYTLAEQGTAEWSGSTELRKSLLCGKVESFKGIHFKGERLVESFKDNEGDK